MTTEVTLAEARAYIAEVRWQFARTMPDWPHEYTIKAWRPELTASFEALCRLIAATGFVEPWPPPPATAKYCNHYLVIDDHKYWAMGERGDSDPIEHKSVINREGLPAPGSG